MSAKRPSLAPPLRWAEPRDAGDLARAYSEAIASQISTLDSGPCTGADFLAKLDSLGAREAALVASHEGAYAGYGWLKHYSDRHGYRFTCETSIFVLERAWGTGVADALQRALLDEAARLSYRHVVAKIMAANARSIRFHERHGFEHVGVQRSVGNVDGAWHDVVILQRLLVD